MPNHQSFTIFYITHESKREAEKFVNECLRDRWIACGNIFRIDSAFIWKEKVEKEGEFVSLVKTGNHLVEAFIDYAEKKHPYETPCLLHWTVEANKAYTAWIYKNVKSTF